MRSLKKAHALASTARIANVPSVAGNVFLGIAIARHHGAAIDAPPFVLLILTGIFLYLAGNFLNDWADRDWDVRHRPERALPQRLFTPRAYLGLSLGFGLLAICCAGATGPRSLAWSLTIAACVVLYTWLHKRAAWSVVPMGLCRALLPVLGYSAFGATRELFPPALLASALGLFCHIVGLSLGARCESMKPVPTGVLLFARLWFPAAALSMLAASWQGLELPLLSAIPAVLVYLGWTVLFPLVFRKSVPVFVSNLLAGIPLIDWIVLFPLGLAAIAATPFDTACMAAPPLAFLAGKALQRLAPAT